MKSMPVAAMFMPVPRCACSLQVFLHPRQAVFGFSRGHVFRADPALVAEPVDEIEKRREIDLSGSGLLPAGNVRALPMPYSAAVRLRGLAPILPHPPPRTPLHLQLPI